MNQEEQAAAQRIKLVVNVTKPDTIQTEALVTVSPDILLALAKSVKEMALANPIFEGAELCDITVDVIVNTNWQTPLSSI